MESSHRWTFVRYFGTQQVPIGMPGLTDRRTDGRTSQLLYATLRMHKNQFLITGSSVLVDFTVLY